MRRRKVAVLLLLAAVMSTGCSGQEKAMQEKVKPVKVIELTEESRPEILHYSGVVSAAELKKLAFKSSGRISRIPVKVGQRVKAGDVLAELDSKELKVALEASKAQMEAARAVYQKALNGADEEDAKKAALDVEKARAAYDYAEDNYKKVEALYNSGAISKSELDKVKLELDVRKAELGQAEEVLKQVQRGAREEDIQALLHQLEQAEADYRLRESMLEDAVLRARTDGTVVEILFEEEEMVSAGYPVVVVRNEALVVNVGLAERDLARVELGMPATVKVGQTEAEGVVTSISTTPDSQSRTYNAEIELKGNGFNLGSIAKVDIKAGVEKGIWVPIAAMLSDGVDYVYIAKGDIAEKREIVIEGTNGSMARVKGLKPGESLIVEGMKRLNTSDRITVLK